MQPQKSTEESFSLSLVNLTWHANFCLDVPYDDWRFKLAFSLDAEAFILHFAQQSPFVHQCQAQQEGGGCSWRCSDMLQFWCQGWLHFLLPATCLFKQQSTCQFSWYSPSGRLKITLNVKLLNDAFLYMFQPEEISKLQQKIWMVVFFFYNIMVPSADSKVQLMTRHKLYDAGYVLV